MSKLNYRAGDSPALRNFQNTSGRMASSDPATDTKTASSPTDDQSLKLAVAISLLRSKLLQKQPLPHPPPPPPSNPPSESDVLRWKRKVFSSSLFSVWFTIKCRRLSQNECD